DRSSTPLVTTTRIVAPAGSGFRFEFSITVRLSAERCTLVKNGVAPWNSWNVVELTVFGFSGWENVSTTPVFSPTPVAPSTGVTEVTTGATVSGVLAVVNCD